MLYSLWKITSGVNSLVPPLLTANSYSFPLGVAITYVIITHIVCRKGWHLYDGSLHDVFCSAGPGKSTDLTVVCFHIRYLQIGSSCAIHVPFINNNDVRPKKLSLKNIYVYTYVCTYINTFMYEHVVCLWYAWDNYWRVTDSSAGSLYGFVIMSTISLGSEWNRVRNCLDFRRANVVFVKFFVISTY